MITSLFCPAVASQVLKMSKCAVPVGVNRLVVKPKKVAPKPAVKFEVLLNFLRCYAWSTPANCQN